MFGKIENHGVQRLHITASKNYSEKELKRVALVAYRITKHRLICGCDAVAETLNCVFNFF